MDLTAEDEEKKSEVSPSPIQSVLQLRLYKTVGFAKAACKRIGIAVLVWCVGYFKFSFLWILLGVLLFMLFSERLKWRKLQTKNSKDQPTDPKEVMKNVTEMFRLSGSQIPSWLYFPDVEKADWMNTVIQQLWPFIGEYVKSVIVEQVQPAIRDSSSLLSTFTFTDIDLGESAPRVSAVKVYGDHHTRRNEIIIDMHVVLDSECNIGVTLRRLQAGISNFRVSGLLRIELQPLLGTMPLIGAVSVAFVKDPDIDFDLTHLANLFDFPGFDVLLRGAIADSVGAMFVLPEKYVLRLCPELDIAHLRYPLPKGLVRIHVLSAKDLEEKDRKVLGFGGRSDPFVTIKGLEIRVGHKQKFKTKIIPNTVDPTWNESFDALISDLQYTSIDFVLYDDDGALNKADFLGCASLSAKTVYECGVVDEVISLADVSSGHLHVRLEWFDLSSDLTHLKEALNQSSRADTLHSAFLNIYVDSAQRLPNQQQETYNPSPVLKITPPGKEPVKTRIATNTNNPVWEENFQVLLRKPDFDQILFELKDKSSRGFRSLNRMGAKLKQGAMVKYIKAVSGCATSLLLEDNNVEAVGLGSLKYSVKNLYDAVDMTVQKPFPLDYSGSNSVLNLRLTLRILKLKSKSSTATSNITFTVTPPSTTSPPQDKATMVSISAENSSTQCNDPQPLPKSKRPGTSSSKPNHPADNKRKTSTNKSEEKVAAAALEKNNKNHDKTSPLRSSEADPIRRLSRPSDSQSVGDASSLEGSFDFEGSPVRRQGSLRERLPVSRTASVASEMSHVGEVNDLRKRLNAKRTKELENGENPHDYGLGRIKLTIRYRKNSLVVVVICAENLIICDEQHQTSDPYVRIYIVPHKNHRKKTKVMKNSLNPTFDQKLEFSVSPKEVTQKKLNVTVKNQTGFLSSEKVLMGQVTIDLGQIDLTQPTTSWFDLELPDKT